MKVTFTKYAQDKFDILKEHECFVTRKQVEDTITAPDRFDLELDPPKLIASKELDKSHDLRVVYLVKNDIMEIQTFYPAEKEQLP